MKVIAVNTIHGGERVAMPKTEFDTADFGISDDEAQALIERGVIKRKMREVTEADEAKTRRPAANAQQT
ncbi:hypothetical protein [Bradyrhizobium sp. RDM4]|uniref:hypothetical protein n=1 Tax=Bradyrhizobium sp. RDM4 TaxID=3378765 RepID=UPI0038FCCEA4